MITTYPVDMLFLPHSFGNFLLLALRPVAVHFPSSFPPNHTPLGRPSTRVSASSLRASGLHKHLPSLSRPLWYLMSLRPTFTRRPLGPRPSRSPVGCGGGGEGGVGRSQDATPSNRSGGAFLKFNCNDVMSFRTELSDFPQDKNTLVACLQE